MTKHHRPRAQSHVLRLPQVWRLQAQDHGVGRVGSLEGREGDSILDLASASDGFLASLACRSLAPISAFISTPRCPRVHVCVQVSHLYKDTGHIGLGPVLMPSF